MSRRGVTVELMRSCLCEFNSRCDQSFNHFTGCRKSQIEKSLFGGCESRKVRPDKKKKKILKSHFKKFKRITKGVEDAAASFGSAVRHGARSLWCTHGLSESLQETVG